MNDLCPRTRTETASLSGDSPQESMKAGFDSHLQKSFSKSPPVNSTVSLAVFVNPCEALLEHGHNLVSEFSVRDFLVQWLRLHLSMRGAGWIPGPELRCHISLAKTVKQETETEMVATKFSRRPKLQSIRDIVTKINKDLNGTSGKKRIFEVI